MAEESQTMNKVLFTKDNNGIARITLNNPKKQNAFDDEIILDLINILSEIEQSEDIRLVVLSSNGKNFSAGADLNWMKRMSNSDYDANMRDASALTTMLQKLNNLAQPTLVIIKGAVFGGGVGLVSCCDIAIASNDSIFSLSEVKVGLVPATIGPYVIRAIGERNARRFFTSGERFGAEVAKNINLVHEVIEESELEVKVEFYEKLFRKNGPKAVLAAKKIVADISNKEIDSSVISHTCKVISELRMSDEGKEGVSAFLEKRDPNW